MSRREENGQVEMADKKAAKIHYGAKDLARDFPQIFRANGTVKRSTLKKKYTLREAMALSSKMAEYVTQAQIREDDLCLMIFSRGGMVQLTGVAAKYALCEREETFIDLIEMGHNFRVC